MFSTSSLLRRGSHRCKPCHCWERRSAPPVNAIIASLSSQAGADRYCIRTCVLPCVQGVAQYTQEKLAADVAGVVRHLGYEKCVLVGHGAQPLPP